MYSSLQGTNILNVPPDVCGPGVVHGCDDLPLVQPQVVHRGIGRGQVLHLLRWQVAWTQVGQGAWLQVGQVA